MGGGSLISTDGLRGEGILPVPAYATKEPKPLGLTDTRPT
ncbi:hypothetical protein SGPA1_10613 [Streptomyces misionensis JCM 4497]